TRIGTADGLAAPAVPRDGCGRSLFTCRHAGFSHRGPTFQGAIPGSRRSISSESGVHSEVPTERTAMTSTAQRSPAPARADNPLMGLLRSIRPRQWVKNVLV